MTQGNQVCIQCVEKRLIMSESREDDAASLQVLSGPRRSTELLSVPAEHAFAPSIDIRDDRRGDEEHHPAEKQRRFTAAGREMGIRHCPGVEKNNLHIENEKRHCKDIEAHVESLARGADGLHAGFVGRVFASAMSAGPEDMRADEVHYSKTECHEHEYANGEIAVEIGSECCVHERISAGVHHRGSAEDM